MSKSIPCPKSSIVTSGAMNCRSLTDIIPLLARSWPLNTLAAILVFCRLTVRRSAVTTTSSTPLEALVEDDPDDVPADCACAALQQMSAKIDVDNLSSSFIGSPLFCIYLQDQYHFGPGGARAVRLRLGRCAVQARRRGIGKARTGRVELRRINSASIRI